MIGTPLSTMRRDPSKLLKKKRESASMKKDPEGSVAKASKWEGGGRRFVGNQSRTRVRRLKSRKGKSINK